MARRADMVADQLNKRRSPDPRNMFFFFVFFLACRNTPNGKREGGGGGEIHMRRLESSEWLQKKGKDARRRGQPHALHTGDTSKGIKHAKREGQGKGATTKSESRAGNESHNARHNRGMHEDSRGGGGVVGMAGAFYSAFSVGAVDVDAAGRLAPPPPLVKTQRHLPTYES